MKKNNEKFGIIILLFIISMGTTYQITFEIAELNIKSNSSLRTATSTTINLTNSDASFIGESMADHLG